MAAVHSYHCSLVLLPVPATSYKKKKKDVIFLQRRHGRRPPLFSCFITPEAVAGLLPSSSPPPPPPPPLLVQTSEEDEERVLIVDIDKNLEKGLVYEGTFDIPDCHSNSGVSRYCDAPLVSALKAAAEEDIASFHFPGHNRGRAAPPLLSGLIGKQPFAHDLPEITDNLFSPTGVILDAQQQAAELFGSEETWFLVGGTTCGVHASIMAACSPGDTLILPRNSHISALSGLVLSGAIPKYIVPDHSSKWDIASGVHPWQVMKAIDELMLQGTKPKAVFITSPTYHGICSDLEKIVKLCHDQGIPVIVDEAHGAHFKFHRDLPKSALEQRADLVIQSTHKVLSSLSQSSMLHASGSMIDRDRLFKCLQMLQSTSPSYLLLASLDAARAQLSENQDTLFNKPMELAFLLSQEIPMIQDASLLKSADGPLPAVADVRSCGAPGFPYI